MANPIFRNLEEPFAQARSGRKKRGMKQMLRCESPSNWKCKTQPEQQIYDKCHGSNNSTGEENTQSTRRYPEIAADQIAINWCCGPVFLIPWYLSPRTLTVCSVKGGENDR